MTSITLAATDTITGYLNVKAAAYGAKGDGNTDDLAALQAVWAAATAGDVIYLPKGAYVISDQLNWTDKAEVTIVASRDAIISPKTGANFANKALLSLVGCTRAVIRGLRLNCTLASNRPKVGLVLGRSATNSGSSMYFDSMLVDGSYTVASVLTVAAEVLTFINCEIISQLSGVYAYLDTHIDTNYSLTPGSPSTSNSQKTFYKCAFKNYGTDATTSHIIGLSGSVTEIHFYEPYFSFGSGGGFAIHVKDESGIATGQTRYLVLRNSRCEGSSIATSRLLQVDATNGMFAGEIAGNNWPLTTAAMIEVAAARTISGMVVQQPSQSATRIFLVNGTAATLTSCQLYGMIVNGIEVLSGGVITQCLVHSTNGYPFTGAGTYDTTSNSPNMIYNTGSAGSFMHVNAIRRRINVVTGVNVALAGFSLLETNNSGATNLTTFTGGIPGQELRVMVKDGVARGAASNTTFVHGTGTDALELAGSTNYAAKGGDVLSFVYDERTSSGIWREIARTVS